MMSCDGGDTGELVVCCSSITPRDFVACGRPSDVVAHPSPTRP